MKTSHWMSNPSSVLCRGAMWKGGPLEWQLSLIFPDFFYILMQWQCWQKVGTAILKPDETRICHWKTTLLWYEILLSVAFDQISSFSSLKTFYSIAMIGPFSVDTLFSQQWNRRTIFHLSVYSSSNNIFFFLSVNNIFKVWRTFFPPLVTSQCFLIQCHPYFPVLLYEMFGDSRTSRSTRTQGTESEYIKKLNWV